MTSESELAVAAREFVRALEAARAINKAAEVLPHEAILKERERLNDFAAEKYAALKQLAEPSQEREAATEAGRRE